MFGYGRKAVRRDLGGGGNQGTGFSWGGGTIDPNEGAASTAAAPGDVDNDDTGKGKKKGKQGKKVLVQWG